MIYSQNWPNQTCDYWLITANQQTLCMKLISFNSGQLQYSGQLQNNTVNGAMTIPIDRVVLT